MERYINLQNLIGSDREFSLEHRIFNVIALIGICMAFSAAGINYFLELGSITVIVPFLCGMAAMMLFYLSRVKRKYLLAVYLTIVFLSFVFFPTMWFINAGTYGGIPYYMMVQGAIIAILLSGWSRTVFVVLYLLAIGVLILTEFTAPDLVTGYASDYVRYFDISFGYYVSLTANIILFAVIIKNYNQERNNARNNELKFRNLAESLPQVIFELNQEGRLTYVNSNAEMLFGETVQDLIGADITDYAVPEDKNSVRTHLKRIIEDGRTEQIEFTVQVRDGRKTPVLINSVPVSENSRVVGVRGFIIDITERKITEMKMKYLSYHDSLTGLRNRHGFERDTESFLKDNKRVGLIVCDVDGLKLVNDTLGHHIGDKVLKTTARIINESVDEEAITARVGGDEFCIIFALTETDTVENMLNRLRRKVDEHNKSNPGLPLSISIGYAISDGSASIPALFKEADDNMYRQKLHHSLSNRSTIVQPLMKALEARDFVTKDHGDRLAELAADFGTAVGLSETQIADLSLLARFHDIGKVGIQDRILFKPGSLNSKEKREIERHCEIGYRIARSAPELAPIADMILKHHEWWNGEGYPLQLKGEEIPLLCRIMAIIDAYDALTNDRPYRKAMSHQQAVQELKRCAGTQFDPSLVSKFLRFIEDRKRGGR